MRAVPDSNDARDDHALIKLNGSHVPGLEGLPTNAGQAIQAAFPPPSDVGRSIPRPSWAQDEEESLPGFSFVGPLTTERKARESALVLQSMSVWHAVRRVSAVPGAHHGGFVLLVRDEDHARAAEALARYEEENRDWPPKRSRERLRHAPSWIVPAVFALMIAFFFVTGPVAGESRWFARGIAVSHVVLGAEPWRAVTALTLHADGVHVLGNAISGTVFGAAVQRRIGPGGALLAITLSGTLGNTVNALVHRLRGLPEHASLGASTAVFGAIGLLAATELVLRTSRGKRSYLDLAAPIVGGLALLGALGSGSGDHRTDLGAHLFGLLAGMMIGLVAALALKRRSDVVHFEGSGPAGASVELGAGNPSVTVQAALGALAATIVLGAWRLALR